MGYLDCYRADWVGEKATSNFTASQLHADAEQVPEQVESVLEAQTLQILSQHTHTHSHTRRDRHTHRHTHTQIDTLASWSTGD